MKANIRGRGRARKSAIFEPRWTITNECGDVLARFWTAEEAWAAICSNAALDGISKRYEQETDRCVLEFAIRCDGVEVVIH